MFISPAIIISIATTLRMARPLAYNTFRYVTVTKDVTMLAMTSHLL